MARQSPQAILLTRPRAQAERFACALDRRFGEGVRCVISPVLEPEFLPVSLPEAAFDALVFTSETGVAALLRLDRAALPTLTYCVGDRTAKAARVAGLTAQSAGGAAADLVGLLARVAAGQRLLHIAGAHRTGDIAKRLAPEGVEIRTLTAYAQVERPLDATARDLLAGRASVLLPLFSPRSAALLSDQLLRMPLVAPLTGIALSGAVARSVDPALGLRVVTVPTPDAAAMIEGIATIMDRARGS